MLKVLLYKLPILLHLEPVMTGVNLCAIMQMAQHTI